MDNEISYGLFTDEQLILERRRLREKLDELTSNPGNPGVVTQTLVTMEHELDRMTDELRQRAITRHPSSGMNVLRRFRSMSWPSDAG